MMSRAWFYNIPFHGHINPTLPLVSELIRHGDQVTYFAGPAFEQKVRAAGADFRHYGGDYTFEQSRTIAHSIHQGGQLAEATAALLPQVLDSVARERPDYILFDMSAPWGNIAAQRFNIPAVTSFPHLPFQWRMFFSDSRVFKKGVDSLKPGQGHYRELQRQAARLAREHKLRKPKELNVLSSSADLNIVFTSRYFQPYDETFDDSYVFIGPVVNTDRQDEPLLIKRRADQKLIYIAVGTVYMADQEFFKRCLQAFGDGRYAVVLSTGKAVDPASLGPIPENFTVAQYVPQLAVLAEADLFITHGGMNSINEAMLKRVPLIVVPNTIEQTINAYRVEELGAGIFLEPKRVTAETLRLSAAKVIDDPAIPQGLARIRDSFLEAGGVKNAVASIQAFKQRFSLA